MDYEIIGNLSYKIRITGRAKPRVVYYILTLIWYTVINSVIVPCILKFKDMTLKDYLLIDNMMAILNICLDEFKFFFTVA